MSEKQIEISSINLKLGKKEFSLSINEAKELKNVLNELFEKEVVKEVHHCPDRWWYQPNLEWSYPNYTVTCTCSESTTNGMLLVKNTQI